MIHVQEITLICFNKTINVQADILTPPLAQAFLAQKLESGQFSSVFVLCDEMTLQHCLPRLKAEVPGIDQAQVLSMQAGEIHKNIDTCTRLWKELSNGGAERNSLLLNLGGGVVTDLGGFVACTYKRGISFINIPTSLLAMVDASVGGKTGIDLGVLKNQVGIIQEPEAVLIMPQFLETLPYRHISNGMVEMLKHGLIADKSHWEQLDLDNCMELSSIEHSIAIKKGVVEKDPTEKGLRKILNFGHTLGHAIESYLLNHPERSALLHGEAIAIGMVLEAYLSHKVCGLSLLDADQIKTRILAQYKKVSFSADEIEVISSLMQHDKKNAHGKLKFSLLKAIGESVFDQEIPIEEIPKAFDYYKSA